MTRSARHRKARAPKRRVPLRPDGKSGTLALLAGITRDIPGLNPSSGFPFLHLFAVPFTPADTRQARKLMAGFLRLPGMVVGQVNRQPDLDLLPFGVALVGLDRIVFTLDGQHYECQVCSHWGQLAHEMGACCLDVIGRPWPWDPGQRQNPRYTAPFLNDPQTRPRAGVLLPIARPGS